jgi:hypothetical protein
MDMNETEQETKDRDAAFMTGFREALSIVEFAIEEMGGGEDGDGVVAAGDLYDFIARTRAEWNA